MRKTEKEREQQRAEQKEKELIEWVPKTETGKMVKNGEITSLDQIFDKNLPLLESEIVDSLVPNVLEKNVDFKKTTKVRRAGRMFSFRAAVLVGDGNQYIGLGIAKDKERWPAIRKATKQAKLNLKRIHKGCGSWECKCGGTHSVPFKITGKCSSVNVTVLPAPKGTGLVAGNNIKDVFKFVGIQDVWCKTEGSSDTKLNFVTAAIEALAQSSKMKISEDIKQKFNK